MASQASEGTRLAMRFAEGEQSDADIVRAIALMRRYSRALAAHFRARQLAEQPELVEVAALFGVGPSPVVPAGPRVSPARTNGKHARPRRTAQAARQRARRRASRQRPLPTGAVHRPFPCWSAWTQTTAPREP
jgi:hypothetical protein